MSRKPKPTNPEVCHRLTAIKLMVASGKGMLPTAAEEQRRETCEAIDDLIADLT